jgi:hypothetical protein
MALEQIAQVHVAVRVDIYRAQAAAPNRYLATFNCRVRLLSAGEYALQAAIYEAETR